MADKLLEVKDPMELRILEALGKGERIGMPLPELILKVMKSWDEEQKFKDSLYRLREVGCIKIQTLQIGTGGTDAKFYYLVPTFAYSEAPKPAA